MHVLIDSIYVRTYIRTMMLCKVQKENFSYPVSPRSPSTPPPTGKVQQHIAQYSDLQMALITSATYSKHRKNSITRNNRTTVVITVAAVPTPTPTASGAMSGAPVPSVGTSVGTSSFLVSTDAEIQKV